MVFLEILLFLSNLYHKTINSYDRGNAILGKYYLNLRICDVKREEYRNAYTLLLEDGTFHKIGPKEVMEIWKK